jgi:SAM-dependent methyltransferase
LADPRPGFNHNDFYHRFLLRQIPPGCSRALDVGCGTGVFASRVARLVAAVDAIDQDPSVIATANAMGLRNVDFIEADLTSHDIGAGRYDFISCLASIHHMPFTETVTKLREALAPNGVLAVIGCYQESTMADYLPNLIASPANLAANTAIRLAARHRPTPQVDTAPVARARMTLPEIRRAAHQALPGATVRRRLFWRYSLTYHQPPPG